MAPTTGRDIKEYLRAYMHGFWDNSVFSREKPDNQTKLLFFKIRFVAFMRTYHDSAFDMTEREMQDEVDRVLAEWRRI